jgi:mono/diheme cytochrome c family protein
MLRRLIALGVAAAALIQVPALAETQIERGKYLATVMDCSGCHTTGAIGGKPQPTGYLAGADVGWDMPGGIVYPANITPDHETGIGAWSTEDVIKLLRTGARPDGREVAPIMNWRNYGQLSNADIRALVAYLKSIPPVHHKVPGPTPMADVKTPYITIKSP